ncbi:MAG TPA: tetratricopeptide repeat protein [Pyrinomonadaceae bacterium]|nr:tetratricopeptide repeat protein [Pyrinomonadaceae bacterium]
MKQIILPAILISALILLLSPVAWAEHFSVKEYEEFHDVLHPLEHEALPKGDFKTIREQSAELARRGDAILKLGVPTGVKKEHTDDFKENLKKFAAALTSFRQDASAGTDAQLKESYSAVHDTFEMLAALLPPVKRGSASMGHFRAGNNSQEQTEPTAKGYLNSGLIRLQQGDNEGAFRDLNKAIELNPRFPEAYYLRGNIQLIKGDYDSALADYNKALELVPNAPGVEQVYNNRGIIRRIKGDREGAFADFNKAVSLNPQYAEAYQGRANIKAGKGDIEGAISDYNKSIELNPNHPAPYTDRGITYLQEGNLEKASTDFDKALKLNPDSAHTYISRSIARGLRGNINGAIADIKKGYSLNPASIEEQGRVNFSTPVGRLKEFISKNPTNARAYAMSGVFRLIKGNGPEAESDFRKSLQLDPSLKPEIERLREAFK